MARLIQGLFNPRPGFIKSPECRLRPGMTGFGGDGVPLGGLGEVFFNNRPSLKRITEAKSGLGISGLSGFAPPSDSLAVQPAIVKSVTIGFSKCRAAQQQENQNIKRTYVSALRVSARNPLPW